MKRSGLQVDCPGQRVSPPLQPPVLRCQAVPVVLIKVIDTGQPWEDCQIHTAAVVVDMLLTVSKMAIVAGRA